MINVSASSVAGSSRVSRAFARIAPTSGDSGVGRQVMVGAAGNFLLNVTTVVANFVIAVLLARTLGPQGYGVYAIATTWAMFLTVAALLGLPPLVTRKISEYRLADSWGLVRGLIRSANRAVLAASVATGTIAVLIGWFRYGSNRELQHAYFLALVLVPLTAIQSIRQAILTGFGRTVVSRIPATLVSTAGFAVVLGIAALLQIHLSPLRAVGLNTATTALAFILSGILLLRLVPRAARTASHAYETRSWRRSAVPLLLASGIQAVNAQAGLLLLGLFEPAAEVGKYGVSLRAATTISFLLLAVSYPIEPTIARLYAQRDLDRLQRLVSQTARGVVLLTLPLAIAMVVFAGPLLHAFFGEGFNGAGILLRILAAGEAVNVLTGVCGVVLLMTGREAKVARGIAAGAAATVVLSLSLIPVWGALGAAIATAAGAVTSNLLLTIFAWRSVRIYTPAFGLHWLQRS